MNINNFYLVWSYDEPKHIKESYGEEVWASGVSWHGPIYPNDKMSLNEWKKEQDKKHERILKEFAEHGKVYKLSNKFHATEEDKKIIESDPNFVKWC
jgi:hypothetical protein